METVTMTPGQHQYAEDALQRARDGEETSVLFTGRRVRYEVVDEPEDEHRPWRLRWTVEAENGDTLTVDEWPPLSREEEDERQAREDADRAAATEAEAKAAAEAEAERVEAERVAFAEAVQMEASRLVDERIAEAFAAAGLPTPERSAPPDEPVPPSEG